MSGRFDEVAGTWDASAMRREIAGAVGKAIGTAVALDRDMDLLDVGAGTGLLTGGICEQVRSVTALDDSDGMLDELRGKAASWGGCRVVAVKGDVMTHGFDRRFDGIVSSMTMHHVEDTRALFGKLASLLAPGGFVALADLSDDDGSFHPPGIEGVYHFGFTEDVLVELAGAAGFSGFAYEMVHSIEKETRDRPYGVFLFTARLTAR